MADPRAPTEPSRSGATSIRIEIAPSSILLGVGVVGAVWVLGRLVPVLVAVTCALMLAGTLAPMLRWLEARGVRRGLALAGLFLGALCLLGVALGVTGPSLWRAAMKFVGDLPRLRDQLVTTLASHPLTASLARSVQQVRASEVTRGVDVGAALAVSASMAEVIGYGITALFLTMYLLADRERLQGALYAVVPRRYHLRTARVLISLEAIVGGYIRGQVITSVLIALFTFVLLTVLRVPSALALAAFAGLTDVIPFVGGILATAPAALSALPLGTGVAIAVLVLMVAYQEFESRLLVPRIYGRTLRLPSAAVLVALLVGGRLGGIFGALFALPIAAAIVSLVKELRVELPGEPAVDPAQREADARAERAYALQSKGASATQAARTALEVAQRTQPPDERH